ncbi:MAG: sigma-54 dependent transcriptional regulator [Syntrophales bacterium]|jgi:two-component system NtrC family response regulator|nr:sigma-54 dependent transcriptional regulator [Syntrophales bacterium]MCK9528710.1 sigma-54 dependent transcriptional regulator [Syntrophales bacterium]MDX9922663.1 sigma-54 dependent transcriptional regulator [Syntrophales bacterium]
MKGLNILITEDERTQRELLRDFLAREGHMITEAGTGDEALNQVLDGQIDMVLLDFKMPGMNGLETLRKIKGINPSIDIIMMTAYGTVETAVQAMKEGALDYITKPVELDELLLLIDRTAERRTLIRENEILRQKLWKKDMDGGRIIYRSPSMESLINMAGRVAASRATVLIQGESGTGKELFARLIHGTSPRADKPMIVVNCSALPETLLESELFGHEKGSFTGATARRVGRFEEADEGTLFLDEIGELSAPVQVKLLRFLQEREFQRLGGNQTLRADVRIISATNRNLEERMKEGTFRDDLYYRLNVVAMHIPPLRERKEDIELLVSHFITRFARENEKPIEGVSSEAQDLLLKYDYPGNVRELENIIERAAVITRSRVISLRDLPFKDALPHRPGAAVGATGGLMKDSVETLECQLIEQALEKAGGNQTRAADILGITERTLRYKMKKYGLKQ